MIKLAIVSPCYNEEEVLEQSAARLTALFDELVGKEKISADSFVLFVNDGSKDRTWNIIKKLHKENPYVKGMNLARNVGHQSAGIPPGRTVVETSLRYGFLQTATQDGSGIHL